MAKVTLNFQDLIPVEKEFELSSGKKYTLKKWSMRVKIWATERYTSQELEEVFHQWKVKEICELAYFMLKGDKPTFDDFLESIVTPHDEYILGTALLATIGIGEVQIETARQIEAERQKEKEAQDDPNAESPNPK